ncbi:MAG: AMP-binding protein [Chlamydiae bacterium]|nr:AMP-binding protein [Chlamydiota bacterium]MBI3266316.1 AMP-binding protein [Chlamydiota bacterium]
MNTLINILERAHGSFASRIALQIKEGENYFRVTYQELYEWAQKIALALKAQGLKPSQRIGLITENSPYWGMVFFGALWAGGVVVPLDNKLKEHSILNILDHAECTVIFTSLKFKETIVSVAKNAKVQPHIIVLDDTNASENSLQKILQIKENSGVLLEKPKAEDLAIILYTSGTTGSPKGVMLTHGNLASNVESVSSVFPFSFNDHFISVLPLCHTYAITADFLIPIYSGGTITYVENLKGPVLVERMQENQGSVLIAVPALIQLMYHQIFSKIEALPKMKRLVFKILRALSKLGMAFHIPLGTILFKSVRNHLSPRLRFMISGGAPIDPKIIQEFFLLGIPIYQGYGLTETSPILNVNTPTHQVMGSVGKPIPGVQIKLKDGEILARGPNIMKGYYKNPEATAEILKDGWLHTGDLGFFDRKGHLHISGRLKNVIVTRGGKNVYPEELEEELLRSTWIREACVIGLKKDSRGFKGDEQVYALIVPKVENPEELKNNPKVEAQILNEIKHVNLRLADYKRIRGFEIWEELPKTTTLKIKRKEILDLLQQKGARPVGGEI